MDSNERTNISRTLPGLGHPVDRAKSELFRKSALSHWERQESRLQWFLEQLQHQPERDNVPYWYGELWSRPQRPGQVETAMAALAAMGSPIARVALLEFTPDDARLKLFRDVCLAHHARVAGART